MGITKTWEELLYSFKRRPSAGVRAAQMGGLRLPLRSCLRPSRSAPGLRPAALRLRPGKMRPIAYRLAMVWNGRGIPVTFGQLLAIWAVAITVHLLRWAWRRRRADGSGDGNADRTPPT